MALVHEKNRQTFPNCIIQVTFRILRASAFPSLALPCREMNGIDHVKIKVVDYLNKEMGRAS